MVRAVQVGLHVASFSWVGGAPAIRETLGRVGEAADAAGCQHVSVMDHYFQIDSMFAVADPMLEAYTTLGSAPGANPMNGRDRHGVVATPSTSCGSRASSSST
jgi:hypothetical protein